MRYWEKEHGQRPTRRTRPPKSPPKGKRSIASGGSIKQYPFLRTFYQHQATISDNLQRFIFFLVLATLLYAFVFGDGGVIRIVSLRMQRAQIEDRVAMLGLDIAALQTEINSLDNEPFKMEKLGRERYGYIRPGDHIYKLIRPHGQ